MPEYGTNMFRVNEEAAWEWLMRAIVSLEMSDMAVPDLPPISLGWQPQTIGEEDTVFLLIRSAQNAGMLTTPAHVELEFAFIDDGDRGSYRYLLRIDEPAHLIVASAAEEMSSLGDPDTTGIDAALAILREAANAGNFLNLQVYAFIAATTTPHH